MESMLKDNEYGYIDENLKIIQEKINKAAYISGRSIDDVTLMAVTKTIDVPKINYVISQGVKIIGENKVQELNNKLSQLVSNDCAIHLIGHLQTNKVNKIVGKVSCIQSVDSIKIAKEIGKYSENAGITTDILLQINAGNEESKFGFSSEEVFDRACEISEISGVKIKGLMCVAPICEKNVEIRNIFSNIHKKFIDICSKKMDNIDMNILSMGMSGDFEEAILEGATMVRIGSSIFGNRNYR